MGRVSFSTRRLVCVLGALVALTLAPGLARARAATAPRATITRLGPAPAGRQIPVELPLRIDAAGLQRFATAVSTPGSRRYGDFASVATLARRFGARPGVRARVVAYLRAHGAHDVAIDATGLYARATLPLGRAQRLFGTSLARFHATADGIAPAGDFVAPTASPRIPSALRGAITGVVGLDTRRLTTPAATTTPPVTSAYPSRSGTAAGCAAAVAKPGFTPNQYLTAYGYDPLHAAGLEGQGERVALIEIDGFRTTDVKAFASCFGLPVPTINAYGVGIKTALPAGAESTLDLELLDAVAPQLTSIDVYESEPVAAEVLRSLTEPLSAPGRKPDVISASLGTCEPDALVAIGQAGINTVEQTLELAAATGVSVIASAGDAGSTACLTQKGTPLNQLSVDYPASSPWVTGVGGTNVHLSTTNTIADPATDQIVWNDEPLVALAGGGGVSMFDKPSYQDGFQPSSKREVPDVSMLADPKPGYEVYCTAVPTCGTAAPSNPWVNLGGTSAGTPLLAGGLALIDQELAARGQENIGFANPLLYKIAHSSAAPATISDVVSGANDLSGSLFGKALGCCSAGPGYDLASGLGSVNLGGLATAASTLVPRRVSVSLTLPAQRHPVRAGYLLATVSCSGQCLMGAYARIRIAPKTVITAYSHPYTLTRRRTQTVRVPLQPSARARIRTALAAHRTVTASIYGAIIDTSGKVVRQTAGRTLRITG